MQHLLTSSAAIKWIIATPALNSDKFEVEYSTDEHRWTTLGTFSITSGNKSNYEAIHNNIPAGNIYYRIKEIDIDGSFMYSNIVVLNNANANTSFSIYPNPTDNFITVTANNTYESNTRIILYDAIGKKIMSTLMISNTQQFSTAAIPDGTYILEIFTSKTSITKKMIIKHLR